MADPVYALNLFNVSNKDEYLAYSRRSAREVAAHGGRVIYTRIESTAPATTSGTCSTSSKTCAQC